VEKPLDNQQVKRQALAAALERSGGEAQLETDELAEYDEELEAEEYEEEGEYEDEEEVVEEPVEAPPARKGLRVGRWDLIFILLGLAFGMGVRGCAR
jgi:hypothetical protein